MSTKLTYVEKMTADPEVLGQTLAVIDDIFENQACDNQEPAWLRESRAVSVECLTLDPGEYRHVKPRQTQAAARFTIVAQLSGTAFVRSGGYRQRRYPDVLKPWELLLVAGPNKWSLENPGSTVSESMLFAVTPDLDETHAFEPLYLSAPEQRMLQYHAVIDQMATLAIQQNRLFEQVNGYKHGERERR